MPPAASTAGPAAAAARTSSRSGPASVPSRSIAVTRQRRTPHAAARASASAAEMPSSCVQPAVRRRPARTSIATTSDGPSASTHGAGSGHAAVPTTTRSAPASSNARASASDRIPPDACSATGAHASATRRTRLGAWPTRAGAVEVDEVDAPRARVSPLPRQPGRIVGTCDHVVVVALAQAHDPVAEHVDGGDHLDRAVQPRRPCRFWPLRPFPWGQTRV